MRWQRYSRLVRFYDAGVMGIDINGMVQIATTKSSTTSPAADRRKTRRPGES